MKVIKHQNRHEFQSLEILKTQLEICPEHTALIWFHPERGLGTDTSRSPSSLNYFVFPGLSPAGWGTKLSQTLPGKVWPIVTSLFCVRDRGMFLFKYCLWVCGSYPLVTGHFGNQCLAMAHLQKNESSPHLKTPKRLMPFLSG